ncbi:serine/threonine-protein kinase pim-2-like [Oryzias latipes]|uniref:serine/threonine-protein kinase pim-2-like n=1 Tax=Oryzias latipes TaxID=8090 RepID=UPI000CE1B02D|nr:serine/threonine-protein kinase pim-2-like [Oryzias latipes]
MMENSADLSSTSEEHVSCVFHQPPSFSKDDGTTSRKKKRSTEEEPDGKKKRLSLPSSQEPESNDASDSGGSSSPEERISLKETTFSPKTTFEKPEISNGDTFEVKYKKEGLLGEGGCGSVYAGHRVADGLPVAIKYISSENMCFREPADDGKQLPAEVAIMLKVADGRDGHVGTTAAVTLLDFYDLENQLIIVMERPTPAECLFTYKKKKSRIEEEETKIILKQLVQAAKELEDKHIFHRDIKMENILIETNSNVPRARLIDFGLSCLTEKDAHHTMFFGTVAHIPPEFDQTGSYSAGPTTVWQLGVLTYEVLHKRFFSTSSFLRKKLGISRELSRDCRNFLRSCLAPLPETRPTLEELLCHPWLRR